MFYAFVAPAAVLVPSTNAVEITDLERTIWDQRRSIAQMHLEMHTETSWSSKKQMIKSTREIWIDGRKRRCDERREVAEQGSGSKVDAFPIVAIDAPGLVVLWNGAPQKPGTRRVVHCERGLPNEIKVFESFLPFDARWVGVSVWHADFLREGPIDWVIASPNRTSPATVTDRGREIDVSFARASGSIVKQTYLRSEGNQRLIRLSVESKQPGQWRSAVEYSYPSRLPGGIGIPNRIETLQTTGESVAFHEVSIVTVKSINQPIPPTRFSIDTIGLPPGTPVVGSALPQSLIKANHHVQWNGNALVAVSNREIMLRPGAGRSSRGSSLVSRFGARAFVAIGLIAFFVAAMTLFINTRLRGRQL